MTLAARAPWCELYLIADTGLVPRARLCDIVERALAAGEGVTAVQLRDKGATARETLAVGREVRDLTQRAGVTFLLNDRLDLALALEADGVHVGPDDLPVAVVRALTSPEFLIGFSAGTPEEARAAASAGASYLGVGAVYATATKPDAGAPIGAAGIAAVRAASALPLVGIGGITRDGVAPVIAAGADGVAVAGAILLAADPAGAARGLRAAVAAARAR